MVPDGQSAHEVKVNNLHIFVMKLAITEDDCHSLIGF